jgi:hypothetical protein
VSLPARPAWPGPRLDAAAFARGQIPWPAVARTPGTEPRARHAGIGLGETGAAAATARVRPCRLPPPGRGEPQAWSATTSSSPARWSSASPRGSAIADVSVLMPIQHPPVVRDRGDHRGAVGQRAGWTSCHRYWPAAALSVLDRHHVGQVDDHAILVGLAVIPRTGQDQTALLVQRTGDRLKRLEFRAEVLTTETSSPPTG